MDPRGIFLGVMEKCCKRGGHSPRVAFFGSRVMEKCCKRIAHSPRAAFFGSRVMEKVLQKDRPFPEGG